MGDLLSHVIVLDRLAHPRRVLHEDSLGADKRASEVRTPDELAARRYKTFLRDAHHLGGDLFAEVAHACQCGYRLEQGPPLEAWAAHVSRELGIPVEILRRHAVAHLHGTPATATCDCGRSFKALADPHDPAEALAGWVSHVEDTR